MASWLTDAVVKALPLPASGNRIEYDGESDKAVKGFGVRLTAKGARAFVLNYRAGGIERRLTIGSFPDWTTKHARDRAAEMKREIDGGADPMRERHEDRAAPTVAKLCDRFEESELPKKRASTQADYRSIIKGYIRPELGNLKVADVQPEDVDRLHRKIAKRAPYRANRTVALLSKMMTLAIRPWRMRDDNPAKGIERAPEQKRERFLSTEEIARLAAALAAHRERDSANAIRLLMLTGARRGETLAAEWGDIDLERGIWTKPGATTKQRTEHRLALSAPALELLAKMKADAEEGAVYLFPRDDGKAPIQTIKRSWKSACAAAGIKRARLHDLRHTYASVLVGAGASWPVIGALLGHTQTQTTMRYAHVADDPARRAAETAGAIIAGKPKAKVVTLKAAKRRG